MIITITALITSLLIFLALLTFAKTIFAIRELDRDEHEAALVEMRKLASDAMIHMRSNSVPEAIAAQAQLLHSTEFLENPEEPEPAPVRPKIVRTADGEEINLNEYDLV